MPLRRAEQPYNQSDFVEMFGRSLYDKGYTPMSQARCPMFGQHCT